ncbi:MAG: hypothetical protein F7C34_01800 [Desulfurococcales archaeon]|nr:hypothetical protein [Desulfurococcales archaeon]
MSGMVGFRGLVPLAVAVLLVLVVAAAPLSAAASSVSVAKYSSLIKQAGQGKGDLHHQELAYYETNVCGARIVYVIDWGVLATFGYKELPRPTHVAESIYNEVRAKAGGSALEYIYGIQALKNDNDERLIVVFVRPDTPRHVLDVIGEALEKAAKDAGVRGLIVINDLQSGDIDALKDAWPALREASIRLANSSDTRKLGIRWLEPYMTKLGFVSLVVIWEPGKGPTPQVINALAEKLLRETGLCGKNITIVITEPVVAEPLVPGQAQSSSGSTGGAMDADAPSPGQAGGPGSVERASASLPTIGLTLLVMGLAVALTLYLRH